jgi:hypothetical protein
VSEVDCRTSQWRLVDYSRAKVTNVLARRRRTQDIISFL